MNISKFQSFDQLESFITESSTESPRRFEEFEQELEKKMRKLECDIKAEQLKRYDCEAKEITVNGVLMKRCLDESSTTILTSCGPIEVARNLYRPIGGGKSVSPLELRVGIIGCCTPLLARRIGFLVGHLPAVAAERVFREFGLERPSKSTCDRVTKMIGSTWEEKRLTWENAIRESEVVPAQAQCLVTSLDGVMVPDKDAMQEAKKIREERRANGLPAKGGPAGFKEVGCGTVSLYDGDGERLSTIRYAREPEAKKKTLTVQLVSETESILNCRPDLTLVALADGAEENWRFFDGPQWQNAVRIVDFWHACEHLKTFLNAVYGEESIESQRDFEGMKLMLKIFDDGIDRVIKELNKLERRYRDKNKRRSKRVAAVLKQERRYFENQRERMRYASYIKGGLPIGSGVVEAACKTLVTQRMKQSGMSWRGGKQSVLTIRSLQQSSRWEKAWSRISQSHVRRVLERFSKVA